MWTTSEVMFVLFSSFVDGCRIRWASYKNKQNQKDGKSSDVVETSPIHVSFISYQVRNFFVHSLS